MPILSKLFGRKQADRSTDSPIEPGSPSPEIATSPDKNGPASLEIPKAELSEADPAPPAAPHVPSEEAGGSPMLVEASQHDAPITAAPSDSVAADDAASSPQDHPDLLTDGPPDPEHTPNSGDNTRAALANEPLKNESSPAVAGVTTSGVAAVASDRRHMPTGKTVIGGGEIGLVPMIPDTEPEEAPNYSNELNEGDIAAAALDAFKAACELLVTKVNALRKVQDGAQIISGLIALVGDLDAHYAADWGIVRRNGLEEVLSEVRQYIVEGDQFILESLENGRGGLSADVFLRDLRTIAPADRPRMVAAYALFLLFVIKCVLRQYLRPLEEDQAQLRDLVRRLDYLVEGIRDTLLGRINSISRYG